MADHGNGTPPPNETNREPVAETPLNLSGKQNNVGTNAENGSKEEKGVAKELAREFGLAERWTVILNGLTLVALIAAAFIYSGQLQQMSVQSWLLATQIGASAVDSSENSKRLAAQLEELSKQASAAQDSANTLKEQMHLTQRPWLAPDPTIEIGKSVTDMSWPIRNLGSVPAIKVRYDFSLVDIKNVSRKSFAEMCDKAKRKTETGTYIIPGSSISLAPQQRNVFIDVSIGGGENPPIPIHTIAGCITYFGQFKDFHHTEFCLTSIVKKPEGPPMLVPCPNLPLMAD